MEKRHKLLHSATANMVAIRRIRDCGHPHNALTEKDFDNLNSLMESIDSTHRAAVLAADSDDPLREVGFNLLIAKRKRLAERFAYEANDLIAALNGVERDRVSYRGVALADAAVDEAMAAVVRAFEAVRPE